MGRDPSAAASSIHRRQMAVSPGISRSMPAFSPATRSFTAPQSLMTTPSKPHSFRSTSVSSHLFSEQNTPLIRL